MLPYVYQASGEYAMLTAAAQTGWLEEKKVVLESMVAFQRAGADVFCPYLAPDGAHGLRDVSVSTIPPPHNTPSPH